MWFEICKPEHMGLALQDLVKVGRAAEISCKQSKEGKFEQLLSCFLSRRNHTELASTHILVLAKSISVRSRRISASVDFVFF